MEMEPKAEAGNGAATHQKTPADMAKRANNKASEPKFK
jgi:hypothetical protein